MSFDFKIKSGDFVLENGDLKIVTGTEKLVQDVLKIALTKASSNIYNPWYGSLISRTLVGSSLDPEVTETMAKSQLETTFGILKSLQDLQVQSGQKVTADELLAAISKIGVKRNIINPMLYEVSIEVLTKAFKKTSAKFVVELL